MVGNVVQETEKHLRECEDQLALDGFASQHSQDNITARIGIIVHRADQSALRVVGTRKHIRLTSCPYQLSCYVSQRSS